MADVIQFQCPACGATLRLPLEMAASQGPCPCCGRQIVAPDPYRGLAAYQPAPPPEPKVVEPFRPFADSPPLIERTAGIEPPPARVIMEVPETIRTSPEPPPAIPTRPSPQRAVFVLSILLTAAVSLSAGYILGARSNWLISRTPFPVMSPKLEATAPPTTKTVLVKPMLPDVVEKPAAQPKPGPVEKPETIKASVAAETALKAFLDAPDWTTRSAYVLNPDKVRAAMEAYSQKAPDGPTAFKTISVQNSYTDKKTGSTLFIFQVVTETHPTGIPVAVAESNTGWHVDWQSFVEFRDDLFKSFADGPAEQTGRFHLIVSAPPAPRAANTENEHFASFLLDPPLPGRQRIAYVSKTGELHGELAAATANGAIFTPLLEIAKCKAPDGKTYLKIVKIVATDWLPEGS